MDVLAGQFSGPSARPSPNTVNIEVSATAFGVNVEILQNALEENN